MYGQGPMGLFTPLRNGQISRLKSNKRSSQKYMMLSVGMMQHLCVTASNLNARCFYEPTFQLPNKCR